MPVARFALLAMVVATLAACPTSEMDGPINQRVDAFFPRGDSGADGAGLDARRGDGHLPDSIQGLDTTVPKDRGKRPDRPKQDLPKPDPGVVVATDPGGGGSKDPGYNPDWVKNPDGVVEKCLKLIPTLCNKLYDCDIPFVDAVAGFCPTIADAGAPLMVQACEQATGLIPGGTGVLGDIVAKIALDTLRTCINDYECNVGNAIKLGQKLFEIIQKNGGLQGGNIQQAIAQALPDLLQLVLSECGASLPFPIGP